MGGSGSAFRLFPLLHAGIFAFRHSAIRHERYPFHIPNDKLPHAFSTLQVTSMPTQVPHEMRHHPSSQVFGSDLK